MVKAVFLESQRSRVRTSLWHSSFKEKNVSSPLTRKDSILWGASVTKRWRARPQTARAQILNSVSGGQWHVINLTIFRRFSWPSLVNVSPKVAWNAIHFISFLMSTFFPGKTIYHIRLWHICARCGSNRLAWRRTICFNADTTKPTHLGRILVQVTIYRRLLIGRDGHLDQSEAYDIS